MKIIKKILKSKSSKGFTLIELLVVASIISLLSSIILASLQDAREKAKETALISFLLEFRNAMELYKTNEGHYPFGQFVVYDWDGVYNTGGPSVSGDFSSSEFQSLIDTSELTPSKLPKNSGVWISTNNINNNGWYDEGITVVCSGKEKDFAPESAYHDTYAMLIDYDTNIDRGRLESLPKANMTWSQGGSGSYYNTDFVFAGGGNYWQGGVACIGTD